MPIDEMGSSSGEAEPRRMAPRSATEPKRCQSSKKPLSRAALKRPQYFLIAPEWFAPSTGPARHAACLIQFCLRALLCFLEARGVHFGGRAAVAAANETAFLDE